MGKTLDRIAKVAQRMESGKRPRHGSSYRGLENVTVEGEAEYYYAFKMSLNQFFLSKSDNTMNISVMSISSQKHQNRTVKLQ